MLKQFMIHIVLPLALAASSAAQEMAASQENHYINRIVYDADADFTRAFCELTGDVNGMHFIHFYPPDALPDRKIYAAPLINYAAWFGKPEACWQLLRLSASIRLKDSEDRNLLNCAAVFCRDPKLIAYICHHDAQQISERDTFGQTPLDVLLDRLPDDEEDLMRKMLALRMILDTRGTLQGDEITCALYSGRASLALCDSWGVVLIVDYLHRRGAPLPEIELLHKRLEEVRQEPRYKRFHQRFEREYAELLRYKKGLISMDEK